MNTRSSNSNIFDPKTSPHHFHYDLNEFLTTEFRCQHRETFTDKNGVTYEMYCANNSIQLNRKCLRFCEDHKCKLYSCDHHKTPGYDCCTRQHTDLIENSKECRLINCSKKRAPGYKCCNQLHSKLYEMTPRPNLVYYCRGYNCDQLIMYNPGNRNYPGCCSACSTYANKQRIYMF